MKHPYRVLKVSIIIKRKLFTNQTRIDRNQSQRMLKKVYSGCKIQCVPLFLIKNDFLKIASALKNPLSILKSCNRFEKRGSHLSLEKGLMLLSLYICIVAGLYELGCGTYSNELNLLRTTNQSKNVLV